MQNNTRIIRSFTLASLLVLAGCSFPGVHKIDIQQGNVVTQDMVDQLRPGMTTRQVRFIMGTPLITDTFHSNRWDYLYSIQVAGGTRKQERISIVFDDNNELQGLGGDFVPGTSRDQAILEQSENEALETSKSTKKPQVISVPVTLKPQVIIVPIKHTQLPDPGSLQEEIQHEVDENKVVPIPKSRLKDSDF